MPSFAIADNLATVFLLETCRASKDHLKSGKVCSIHAVMSPALSTASERRVQHPRINEAAEAVRAAAAELRVQPYVEGTGAGALRYLQLTAVGTDPERPAAQHDPRALVQACARHGA